MTDTIEIITRDSLASYLRLTDEQKATLAATLDNLVELTNELITEKWVSPIDPVPTSVKLLGLKVAARGYGFDPTAKQLQSITRSTDNTSRTERFVTGVNAAADAYEQIFLTGAELRRLNPRRRRTIRTHVPPPV